MDVLYSLYIPQASYIWTRCYTFSELAYQMYYTKVGCKHILGVLKWEWCISGVASHFKGHLAGVERNSITSVVVNRHVLIRLQVEQAFARIIESWSNTFLTYMSHSLHVQVTLSSCSLTLFHPSWPHTHAGSYMIPWQPIACL